MSEDYVQNELLKFKEKYTYEEYKSLFKFQIHVLYRYLHIAIYFLLFFILSVYLYKDGATCIQCIFCYAFIPVYTIFIYFLPNLINYFFYSKNGKYKDRLDLIVNFEIFDDYMNVSTSLNSNCYACKYRSLYKVYETKTHFFLYINKTQAYIISKKQLTGNINNFRKIIRKNVNKKYKKIY